MPRNTALIFTLFALTLPPAALAETFEVDARVTGVTLYPWGASVVREVRFEGPAGVHDLLIPGLPRDTAADRLRVSGDAGVEVGAATLIRGRQPVTEGAERPEVTAAEAEIERLEGVLRDHDARIAATRARVLAAEEQIAFLKGIATPRGQDGVATGDLSALRELMQLVGEEALSARQAILAAQTEASAEARARLETEEALEAARQHLAALINAEAERLTLSLAVSSQGEAAVLEVTTFTANAYWSPVYDLRLTRGDTPTLTLDRGVEVSQASGEDWRGVQLTLSTARPSGQSGPSELWPMLRRIYDPEEPPVMGGMAFSDRQARMSADIAVEAMAAPMVEEAEPVFEAATVMEGATVTYRYPRPVDLRDGVEELRLSLDSLDLTPELTAIAVPSRDTTAFLQAAFANDTGQILLPGSATLILDGAMIGSRPLALLAEGARATVGFGPIDGLQISRRVPDRVEGDQGVFVTSNEIREVAILEVENLTSEAWPLRVLDQVPYSEQEDLEIEWSARPRPSEENVDDRRGVLAWDFEIAPGESREIRLEHSMTWPEDQVLR